MQPPRYWKLICVLALGSLGCQSLLYDLQPHRLRRLNRHPAPSMDPEFSAIDRSPGESTGLALSDRSEHAAVVRAQSPALD